MLDDVPDGGIADAGSRASSAPRGRTAALLALHFTSWLLAMLGAVAVVLALG